MGLTAGVYKSLQTGSDAWREKMSLIDAETGEIDYKEAEFGQARSTGDLFAARADLGNAAMIAWLAEEIRGRLSERSLLLTAILYNGTHSGDLIPCEQLDEVGAEVKLLLSNPVPLPPDLAAFLAELRRLVDAARSERNPVVFI